MLPAEIMLETNMDFDTLRDAGSMFGSGAVMVMDETTCMVKVLERISRFYYAESCGQCTPCREGTGWMNRVVKRILDGRGRSEDLDMLDSVSTRSRVTPSAPSAMPPPGRCRASSSTSATNSST